MLLDITRTLNSADHQQGVCWRLSAVLEIMATFRKNIERIRTKLAYLANRGIFRQSTRLD